MHIFFVEYSFDALSDMEGTLSSRTFADTIGKGVFNIMNQIVFGRRLDYDDPDFICLSNFNPYFMTLLKARILPFYRVSTCIRSLY